MIVSMPHGFVSRVSDYTGDPQAVRRWLHDWLVGRAHDLEEGESMELSADASFLVLTVRRSEPGQDYSLGEFTYGAYPAAPEDWRCVPMNLLLTHAVRTLA